MIPRWLPQRGTGKKQKQTNKQTENKTIKKKKLLSSFLLVMRGLAFQVFNKELVVPKGYLLRVQHVQIAVLRPGAQQCSKCG